MFESRSSWREHVYAEAAKAAKSLEKGIVHFQGLSPRSKRQGQGIKATVSR